MLRELKGMITSTMILVLIIPVTTTTIDVDNIYDMSRECNDLVDSMMKTRGSKVFNLSNPIDEGSFKYIRNLYS